MSQVLTFNTEELAKSEQPMIPIYSLVNTHLTTPTVPFDFNNTEISAVDLASRLVETCKRHKGLGLSANQCGLNYRVFVMGHEDNYVAFFNPEILEHTREENMDSEGCLSFPYLTLKISRPNGVKVRYQDFNGEVKTAEYTGLTARCFMHEFDHMFGIVYTQRAKPLALKSGVNKRDKLFRRFSQAQKKMAKAKK